MVCVYVCVRICGSHLFCCLFVCNLSNSAIHVFFFFNAVVAVVVVVVDVVVFINYSKMATREKRNTSWVQLIGTKLMALKPWTYYQTTHKIAKHVPAYSIFATALLVAARFLCFSSSYTHTHVRTIYSVQCLHISANL